MEDPEALDESVNGVDAALRLGFGGGGASEAGVDSVLRALDSKLGGAPRRLLREDEHGEAGSPPVTGTEEYVMAADRGRYRIVGELARGGMGVVLKGHDVDLCRDVALKVLSPRLAGDPDLVNRFIEEAQVGGQLQHPGIVPVYEMGLMADKQPYIAMKLVKGRTLSNLLAERESPSSELRRFLGIFEQVCQTLAYTHSRGVIHRDLKPANVMVGAFGEVQVVDWGLAKVLQNGGTADEKRAKSLANEVSVIETVRSGDGSGGSASRVGSVMGTPAYMSPEQARGEVQALDERTDVFALGAVLCEVLTGRPPYMGEGEETVQQAAEARLGGAVERLAQCGADAALVELCERCLRPARAARPRNAEVVAAEVSAYLASVEERAQEARDDAAVAHGRAVAERKARRVTVTLASSLLLAGLAGVVGWRTVENRERSRLERVEGEVQAALDEALEARGDDRLADASSSAKRAMSLAAAERVGGGLEARARELASAIAAEEAAASAARERAAHELRFLAQLERVRLIEPHDPLEEFEREDADWHEAPAPLSEEERASQWKRRAAAYARVFTEHGLELGADDDALAARIAASEVAMHTALALDDWARVLRNLDGRDEEARRLVGLAKSADADDLRGRMRVALLAEDSEALLAMAGDPRAAQLPAASLFLLGQLLMNEEHADVAVELLSVGVEAHPADFALRQQLGRSLAELDPPRSAEALRHYTAARALRPDSVLALGALGRALAILGEFEASRVVLERAVGLDPENSWLHRQLASSLDAVGDRSAALAAQREAMRLEPEAWRIRTELARLLEGAGDRASALEETQEAVRLAPNSAGARAALSNMVTHVANPQDGLAAAREATKLDPKDPGGPHAVGHALAALGRFDEALLAFREARELDIPGEIDCMAEVVGLRQFGQFEDARALVIERLDRNPGHAKARTMLADLALELGDPEEAAELVRELLEDRPGDVGARMVLVRIALAAGDPGEVVSLCNEILADHPAYRDALNVLGYARCLLGEHADAIDSFERSLEQGPYQWNILNHLGRAMAQSGRVRESLKIFLRGLAIVPEDQDTLRNYCLALGTVGDLDRAVWIAQRAYDLDRDFIGNEWRLGTMLVRKGEYGRAIEYLSRAVVQNPEHWASWNDLGRAQVEVGRREAAIESFERAVLIDPRNCHPYHCLGDLHALQGDIDLAAAIQSDSIDINPECPMGYKHLADLERARGNHVLAADLYRQSLEWGPNSSAALNELAWLLVTPGREPYDPNEALGYAERLVDLESAAGLAWCVLGVARYRADDNTGAEVALDRAVELGPDDARSWLYLAMARHRLGHEEEARAGFEHAEAWLRAQPAFDEGLKAIEREARQLLGL